MNELSTDFYTTSLTKWHVAYAPSPVCDSVNDIHHNNTIQCTPNCNNPVQCETWAWVKSSACLFASPLISPAT